VQTLDIDRPGMPDLQFVLLVTALCTSRLTLLNVPDNVRTALFDRCWVLVHESPPPGKREERVIDLRPWSETTLEAMIETIRTVLTDAGIQTLTWDHSPSEPTWTSTPEAIPLIRRLEQLYPLPSEPSAHRQLTKVGSVTDTLPSIRKGNVSMDSEQTHLKQLIGEMSALMTAFPPRAGATCDGTRSRRKRSRTDRQTNQGRRRDARQRIHVSDMGPPLCRAIRRELSRRRRNR